MRIASPASKSPSKPVQALTGTLFGVKLWQSLSAVSVARLFFLGDPGPKTTPLCNPNPIIISSNCQVYLCKVPCSCHHARIFPACTLQTDPAGSFYYRAAGSVLSPHLSAFTIQKNFLSIKIRCRCRTHFRHLHALHQDLIDFFAIQFTRICLYDIAGISNFPEYLRCDLHI